MRILLVSSAVGAIGDGLTGGVSDAVCTTAIALCRRGYDVDIMSSENSAYTGPAQLIRIAGRYQPTIVAGMENAYPIIPDALIGHYWQYVLDHQSEYAAVINFCHDWLPYYLTPFLNVPVLHRVNVGQENAIVTEQIQRVARRYPSRVAALTRAQVQALGLDESTFICSHGIDMGRYAFQPDLQIGRLIWCARISREKGLEDAAEIAKRTGKRLIVCGFLQDAAYFDSIRRSYGDSIEYRGLLGKEALVKEMGQAEALLCTHKWLEAFGLVAIEAMACGTPVITYNRGGPAETVAHKQTGFVVDVDDIDQAVSYVGQLGSIRREACRRACEERYSLDVYGERIEMWLKKAFS